MVYRLSLMSVLVVVLVSLMRMPTTVAAAAATTIKEETTQVEGLMVDQNPSSTGRLRKSISNLFTTTTNTNQEEEEEVAAVSAAAAAVVVENEDFFEYRYDELLLGSSCQDDTTYRYENDPLKDCLTWVSLKPNKRCSKNSGVVFIFDNDDDNNEDSDNSSDTTTTTSTTSTSTTDEDTTEEDTTKNKMEVTIKFFCPSVCNSKCLDNENDDKDHHHNESDNENENESENEFEVELEKPQHEEQQQRDLRSWSWGSSSAGAGSSSSSTNPRVSSSGGGGSSNGCGNSYLSRIFCNPRAPPPPSPQFRPANNRRPRRPVLVPVPVNIVSNNGNGRYSFSSGRVNGFGRGINSARNQGNQVYLVEKPSTPWTGMYQTIIYVPTNRPVSAAGIIAIAETEEAAAAQAPTAPVAPTTPRPSVSSK